MRRLAGALLASLAGVSSVAAQEFRSWPTGYEAGVIEADPWRDATRTTAFEVEDAYVFSDVVPGVRLSADAVAAAVRFDVERLARSGTDVAAGTASVAAADERVVLAFERFASIGADGRAYASLDLARGRAGPATLMPAPAVFAMTTPIR